MQDDTDHQVDPFAASKRKFSAAVDSINADFFAPAKIDRPPIDTQERAARQKAIDSARASIALEGFVLDGEAEALFARYIDGELSRDELNAAVLLLAASYGRSTSKASCEP